MGKMSFRQGFFSCFDDCGIALKAMFCPCKFWIIDVLVRHPFFVLLTCGYIKGMVFGDFGHELYQQNYCLSACMGCCCFMSTGGVTLICFRCMVRREKRIAGGLFSDTLAVCICCPCSFVQLAAEVAPPPMAGAPVQSIEMTRWTPTFNTAKYEI